MTVAKTNNKVTMKEVTKRAGQGTCGIGLDGSRMAQMDPKMGGIGKARRES